MSRYNLNKESIYNEFCLFFQIEENERIWAKIKLTAHVLPVIVDIISDFFERKINKKTKTKRDTLIAEKRVEA